MLQDIRQNVQGTAAKIIVGLIVISFSFFGIESILVGSGSNSVAEVNGEEISPQELQQSVDTQKRRLISVMGENLDPAMLDDERLTMQALNSLIGRKLVMQSAQEMELAVSEQEIGTVVSGMQQFQVDGVFSPEMYKSTLSSAGYTPASFKQILHEDMLLNQLRSGLAGTEFATPSELAINAQVLSEQRDVRYMTIPQEKFLSQSSVNDADIEAFYTANESNFLSSESVDVDYIELAIGDFTQPVSESAITEAYEEALQDFNYQAQNRVSHILFESGSEDEIAQRVAQAQSQLAEGQDFAAVAAEFSEDVGSAARGGDLGYSTGDAFPDEMEDAIATLRPGVVSAPLVTDAGTHLLIVTERAEGEVASLEEMRSELELTLQQAEARASLLRTVETLSDLSFNAGDLDSPAAELELELKQVQGITRAHSEGLFASAQLLRTVFSEEVLKSGHNSEVVELPGDLFVVVRVREHFEPQVRPLSEVRAGIVAAMNEENARQALEAAAQTALLDLTAGSSIEQYASSQGYEWQVELGVKRSSPNVVPEIVQRLFSLPRPQEGGSSFEYLLTRAGDAVVIELARVSDGNYDALAEAEQAQMQGQVSGEFSGLINSEFESGLRTRAEVSTVL